MFHIIFLIFLWINNLLLRLVDEYHFCYLQCNSLMVFVYLMVMMLQLDYQLTFHWRTSYLRFHRCLWPQRLMCQINMTKGLVGHIEHNSKTHYVSPCISWCSYLCNLYDTKCRMNHNIPLLFSRWPLYYDTIRVITKLPNCEQSYKGKVKTHKYINRQNQSTTGKLWTP